MRRAISRSSGMSRAQFDPHRTALKRNVTMTKKMIAPVLALTIALSATPAMAQSAQPAQGGMTLTRSEEHTSELQSLMRISYAVFCLKKKKKKTKTQKLQHHTKK